MSELRAIPWSCEAEQAVLGSLLIANRKFAKVASFLKPEHFFDSKHRAIYEAIAKLINASEPADLFSVTIGLGEEAGKCGGTSYLNDLANSVANAESLGYYANIVVDRANQRDLIAIADNAVSIAFQSGSVAEKVDQITTLFGQVQRQQVKNTPRAIADIAIERTAHYEALADGTAKAGWRTHIPALTSKLNGGMRPGSLYILAARPSVGKSSFAQDLGINFARDGLPTLFLSQEMANAEVADRAVSNTGRVSYTALLTGKMSREDWGRALDANEALARLPFHVDDQPALTLQDIRFKAKEVRGLKVLIVDYLQLCASSKRESNRNAEIEEISRGLKTLAKELGLAVLALSQLNRAVETRASRRPMLADLRDSGAIEQDADVVMFLWPVREFENEGRKIVGLGIDKNRQGRLGDVGLDFFGDVQRWQESEADIRPEPSNARKGFE